MAAGNTFGATALSSYGGFWISLSIVFTPGGFDIQGAYKAADNGSMGMFYDAFGLYLMVFSSSHNGYHEVLMIIQGWFIFTFLLWLCTLKSTYVFCALFAAVDIALLLLAVGYIHRTAPEVPNAKIIKAGGLFALLGAFMAWYVALAGIADDSNSFFLVPVFHFPWSEKGRESRRKEGESGESV